MADRDGVVEFYNSPTLPMDKIVKDRVAQLETSLSRMACNNEMIEFYNLPTLHIETIVEAKIVQLEANKQDDAFFVIDLSAVYRKLEEWNRNLPTVQPFYALKCNNDPIVTKLLADAGVAFDCASEAELKQILRHGVQPSRIIFANPCKLVSHLRFAAEHNVDLMTFDDIHELLKIKKHFPHARLILRIQTRAEFKAKHNFNKKYGCYPSMCESILQQAKELSMNVAGICFHIGSLPEEGSYFATAIADASRIFDIAENLGFQLTILDIGGGFPGINTNKMTFEKVAEGINEALQQYFPASRGVRVIAEPGRYFVTTCCTLAVHVVAKKIVPTSALRSDTNLKPTSKPAKDDPKLYMYYINDGIYGSFNNVFTDHAVVWPRFLKTCETGQQRLSIIWGPTCDSLDCVMKECLLPEMDVGQWVYFPDMGAYTITLSCDFNGITRPLKFYVCDLVTRDKMKLSASGFHSHKPSARTQSLIDNGHPYFTRLEMEIEPNSKPDKLNWKLTSDRMEPEFESAE